MPTEPQTLTKTSSSLKQATGLICIPKPQRWSKLLLNPLPFAKMMLLLWILTNATVLARQSNRVSALPKSTWNPPLRKIQLVYSEHAQYGQEWALNSNSSHSKIWMGHAPSFVQSLWERASYAGRLGAQTQSPWGRAYTQGPSQVKWALQSCEAPGLTWLLCIQHIYQKLCWAVGTTTTFRGIGGHGRATPPQLRSRGSRSGEKQELPHHDTAFGGTE